MIMRKAMKAIVYGIACSNADSMSWRLGILIFLSPHTSIFNISNGSDMVSYKTNAFLSHLKHFRNITSLLAIKSMSDSFEARDD